MAPAGFDTGLLSRVEDAGLNAAAPPQQRWVDGWLLRLSPGKAKRARCINAVAPGLRPWREKLTECCAAFADAGLPAFVRITPFTQPLTLDAELAAIGWTRVDDTRVMLCERLDALPEVAAPLPQGLRYRQVDAAAYAAAVGQLRKSPDAQVAAHAERLRLSPVPYHGVLLEDPQGAVLACGQVAVEGPVAGLYDVFTAPAVRGRGLARRLCTDLLVFARGQRARHAYLQVDAVNAPARAVYGRLGFVDAYAYHYRSPVPDVQ